MKSTAPADLLPLLAARFAAHPHRHADIEWSEVADRLAARPEALAALAAMEASGGAPDVIGRDPETGEVVFVDCAPESPAGRRSLCYDQAALDARKANKPAGAAVETAAALGARLLTEAEYRLLQSLEPVDQKTSSWVETPPAIRQRGGALFCDRRYGAVFIYHNGADAYYAARGFRARLVV